MGVPKETSLEILKRASREMDVSNPIWMVSGGIAAALCCIMAMVKWMHRRRLIADVKLIRMMTNDDCDDWVLARYGHLVEGPTAVTRSQKLEVIRRRLEYETGI